MIGLWDALITSLVTAKVAWARSMIIPARFISRTMDLPSGVKPLCTGELGLYVANLIDVVVHQGHCAHAIAESFLHTLQPVLDEIASLNREDGGDLVAPMRSLDIGRLQSCGNRMACYQRLQFAELPPVVGVGFPRLKVAAGLESLRGGLFQQTHIGDRRKQRSADASGLEIRNSCRFERLAEGARGWGRVSQCREKKRPGWLCVSTVA